MEVMPAELQAGRLPDRSEWPFRYRDWAIEETVSGPCRSRIHGGAASIKSLPQREPMRMDYCLACAALLARGTVFRLKRCVGRPMRPQSITITVTRKCNSHCIMCNIWRLGRAHDELTRDEIVRFLCSPHFSGLVELDLTGGEPFLREDLSELIADVADLKDHTLRNLQTVALATNGLLPDLVCGTVKRMLSYLNGRCDLVMVCSLDGIGPTHDLVRGTPGSYTRVMQTIEGLKGLTAGPYPLRLGVKTTILPHNWDQIPHLIDFARDQGVFHILSPVLFTRDRFRNAESRSELDVLHDRAKDLIDLYSRDDQKDKYFSHVVTRTLELNGRTAACSAAGDHFFVEGDGRIFPCPMRNVALGNIRTHSLAELSHSRERANAARKAGRDLDCRWCLEPGCIRFSQTTTAYGFLRFILGNKGRRRFRVASVDEGMSKYLP